MRQVKITVFAILYVSSYACHSEQEDALQQVFNAQEMVEVNKIIDYYDSYVWSHTEDKTLPLEEAYELFAEKNTALTLTGNDVFVPSREERIAFFETLDPVFLDTMFHIADTFYLYKMGSRELVDKVYHPYIFQLKYRRYLDLMEILSVQNDFFKMYYETIETNGSFSPWLYNIILFCYHKEEPESIPYNEAFDFSRKDERFTFIALLLFIDDVQIPDGMQIKIKYKNKRKQEY